VEELGGARASGAGRATLKRAIFLNSLARAESGQRPGLLEYALRLANQRVAPPGPIFYSRRQPPSLFGNLPRQTNDAFTLPAETARQRYWRLLKDDKNRLYQAQQAVQAASGAPVPESVDGYLAAALFQTKTSAALKRYQDLVVAPLIKDVGKALRETGATAKDLDR
jgi:hypothetical protein